MASQTPGTTWTTDTGRSPFIRAELPRAAHGSYAATSHDFVTFEAFVLDLRSIARRLGYPLDDEAVAMLSASMECPADCWEQTPTREAVMSRARKTVLHAVIKAVNSGSRYVDGRLMALTLSDAADSSGPPAG